MNREEIFHATESFKDLVSSSLGVITRMRINGLITNQFDFEKEKLLGLERGHLSYEKQRDMIPELAKQYRYLQNIERNKEMVKGTVINRVLLGSIEFLKAGETVEIVERLKNNFLIRKIGLFETFSCPANNLKLE